MTTQTTTVADKLAAVRQLAPMLEEQAIAHEEAGTLTSAVVDALHDGDLFRLLTPACVGGTEATVRTAFEVIEEASRADGATGWSLMAGAIYLAAAGAYLPDEGAEAVLAHPRSVAAGQAAPIGTARRTTSGFAIEGNFGFASGGLHANWFYGGYREIDADGATVVGDDGLPSMIVAIVPRSAVELRGGWDVIGLVGTGSVDYGVPEQEVDESQTFRLIGAEVRRGHPRFRIGLAGLTCIGHAGFAVGVARRALDEVAGLAVSKRRKGRTNLIDDPLFQSAFAECEAALGSARAFALEALDALEAAAIADGIDARIRARARLATSHAARAALEVAATAFRFSGSTGLRNGSAIQRCHRDLTAGEQHVFTDFNTYRDAGQLLLGVGSDHLLR